MGKLIDSFEKRELVKKVDRVEQELHAIKESGGSSMFSSMFSKLVKDAKGDIGPKGDKGERGEVGPQGESIVGPKGERGEVGPKGDDGNPGKDGKNGITPIKGIDYFDGAPGTPGERGDDGAPDTGEQIVDKINGLPTTPDKQIDASHIKNLPKAVARYAKKTLHRGGGSSISVDSSEVTDPDFVSTGDIDFVATGSDVTANLNADTVGLDELSATGTPSSSTFLRGDNSWATPAGSGDVAKVGTPVNGQLGVWTGDGTIEGDPALTFDDSDDTLVIGASGKLAFGAVDILSDSIGTTTLANIDALDATTEATIESAIDTLANLTSIQGQTVTLADAGANAIFGWDDTAGAYENLTAAEVRTVINVEDGADVTDTTNVTAAGALMDSEVTNLAQVKAFDTTDYATAAQGSTADSALQDVVDDTTPTLGGALDAGGFDINNGGVIFLTEQAAAELDVAGKGQLWVKTATPNELWFTDDAGTDIQLGTFTTTLKTKLDGIETAADVTDEANVTDALDGATLTAATLAGTDKVLIQDTDDSDILKTVTAQSIADLAGGMTWNEQTGTSDTMAVDNGYIANNAGLVTFTLPTTAAVGSVVRVAGVGAGGWAIAQNASEIIHFGNQDTTTGTGGSLASVNRYDAVELVCVVADTEWSVLSSQGNITVV